jgi:hypothetical protein
MIKESINTLGRKAVDKVTGYAGVITSISFDLYGCVQAIVTPPVTTDSQPDCGKWCDMNRLDISDDTPVMPVPDFDKAQTFIYKIGI